jgi:5-methylcytosine-specific restriction endonuclease McrA
VVPRAQGGRTAWTNLVTACQKCNAQKGNLSLEEAGLELPYEPYRPNFLMFVRNFSGQVTDSWKPFLLYH